jgi:hypothetical protein
MASHKFKLLLDDVANIYKHTGCQGWRPWRFEEQEGLHVARGNFDCLGGSEMILVDLVAAMRVHDIWAQLVH